MSTGHAHDPYQEAHDALRSVTYAVEAVAIAERCVVRELLELWPTAAWRAAGCTSPTAWLRAHARSVIAEPERIAVIVALCHEHPDLARAVLSGELATGRAATLARHATAERWPYLGPSLGALLDANRNLTHDDRWADAVRFWAAHADQERTDRPGQRPQAIYLHRSLFGGGEIHGHLNEATLHNLDAALDAFGTPPDPEDAPYRRTAAERRADALDDMAHFALGHTCPDPEDIEDIDDPGGRACEPDSPWDDDDPFDGIGDRSDIAGDLDAIRARLAHRLLHPRRIARTHRRHDASVQVVIDLATLTGRSVDDLGDLTTAECRTAGWAIAESTARRFLCDARLSATVLGGRRHLIDANTRSRLFSPAQRRALAARDAHCVFPSCTRPARWCDIHHLHPVGSGGPTTVDNAATLCRFHHTLVHDGGWSLHHDADGGWAATDRTGRRWREQSADGTDGDTDVPIAGGRSPN